MGETLGLSAYPKQRHPVFLQTSQNFSDGREYSDATAAKLDEEIKSILTRRERRVTEMLTEKKEILIKISERLLKQEVLHETEFKSLLGQADSSS